MYSWMAYLERTIKNEEMQGSSRTGRVRSLRQQSIAREIFIFSQISKALVGVLVAVILTACVTVSSLRLTLKPETITANYPRIKQIVVEEAANNGFRELTSEIKPTE